MVEKIATYGVRKNILIGQESYYIALPCRVNGTPGSVIKAGEPLKGDIEDRDTAFTANTSGAVGINLHDVKLDSAGNGNATLVLAGCVDVLKLESTVAAHVETAKADLDKIIFVKGSAI